MIYLALSFAVLASVTVFSLRVASRGESARDNFNHPGLERAAIVVVIPTLLCSLVIGLRHDTGTDYGRYIEHFNAIADGAGFFYREPGYVLMVRIVQSITESSAAVFFSLALITNAFIFCGIGRLRNLSPVLIAAGFFGTEAILLQVNLVRQAAAIGIFFYAAQFIHARALLRYTLLVLLAASFHYSAVILYPLYWLARLPISFAAFNVLAAISLVVFFVPDVIRMTFAAFQSLIPAGYSGYVSEVIEAENSTNTGVGVLGLFATSYFILYSAYRYIPKFTDEQRASVNLLLFYLVLDTGLSNIAVIGRLSEYLALFLGVGCSIVASKLMRPIDRSLIALIALTVFMVNFGWSLITSNQGATPYRSVLVEWGVVTRDSDRVRSIHQVMHRGRYIIDAPALA
jgi:hypothetical protein